VAVLVQDDAVFAPVVVRVLLYRGDLRGDVLVLLLRLDNRGAGRSPPCGRAAGTQVKDPGRLGRSQVSHLELGGGLQLGVPEQPGRWWRRRWGTPAGGHDQGDQASENHGSVRVLYHPSSMSLIRSTRA